MKTRGLGLEVVCFAGEFPIFHQAKIIISSKIH